MAFVMVDGEIVHTSALGANMPHIAENDALANWAYEQVDRHEDIAHVQITITHKDGSKTDYREGDARAAGVTMWGVYGILGDPRKGVSVPTSLSQDHTGEYHVREPKR